jgi:iron complex transport system substrate-binding protein
MIAGPRHAIAVCAGLLTLVAGLAAGCERRPTDSGADAPPESPDPPAASRPIPQTHDWVRNPVVDPTERTAALPRIVSAAPSVTEICCALGLREALVGRTRYCEYPPEIEQVQSIGALIDVNVETLLALRPDLILVAGASRAQTERFAPLNLRVEAVPDRTLEDLFAAIRRVGALTHRARTAERLCEGIQSDLAAVTARFSGVPAARVLLLTGTLSDPPRPPYVAGPGSFYDDLLAMAGYVNVVASAQAAFAPLSLEFIVRADPDVIIELDPDGLQRPGGDARAREVWGIVGALRAVTNGRVHVLVGPEHYLLGPRIAQTYDALCRAIAGKNDE